MGVPAAPRESGLELPAAYHSALHGRRDRDREVAFAGPHCRPGGGEPGASHPDGRRQLKGRTLMSNSTEYRPPVPPFTTRPRSRKFARRKTPGTPVILRKWLSLIHQAVIGGIGANPCRDARRSSSF